MEVKKLRLNNFRNFSEYEIEPGEGVNVIYGDNARGKTNIIEAIWLFTGAKSFRTNKDSELIKNGESYARTELEYNLKGRINKSSIIFGEKKSVEINGVKSVGGGDLVGRFTCAVFTPMHMDIVKGCPGDRRRFLDTSICQINSGYLKILKEYMRVLAQRNALLKDIQYESALLEQLDVWDMRLCDYATKIREERQKYIDKISKESEKIYEGISGGREKLEIIYRPGLDFSEDAETQIAKARANDIKYGTTTVGPHRDDIEINLKGISARSYGSQGQQRSCALSLKLAESAMLKEETGSSPVILLDDVMSELDRGRREYILKRLGENQVFVTCCDRPEDYADISERAELKSFYLGEK